MKKLYILALAMVCCVLNVIAAGKVDLIIKMNSEKIEALIQEVSNKEIRYKKANNPNGPMFVMDLEEVATIMYANGEVQVIEHKAAPQPIQQPQQNYSGYDYGNNSGYNNNGYNNSFNGGYNNGFNDFSQGPMRHLGKDEYMIEGHRLKGKELNYFLQNNCPKAYKWHKTWHNCEIAGWCLLGVGGALVLACGLGAIDEGSVAYGCIPGIAILAGSVPLVACGNIYKKRTHMVFNQYCAQSQAFQAELKLTASPNGLGLALSF